MLRLVAQLETWSRWTPGEQDLVIEFLERLYTLLDPTMDRFIRSSCRFSSGLQGGPIADEDMHSLTVHPRMQLS